MKHEFGKHEPYTPIKMKLFEVLDTFGKYF
jgi:hypothetical protein